jgi:hypothetical protein
MRGAVRIVSVLVAPEIRSEKKRSREGVRHCGSA